MRVAITDIVDELGEGFAGFVDEDSPEFARIPAEWRAIAESAQPRERCAAALALWNGDFLDLLPRFADKLRQRLVDVRACVLRGDWVLVYLAHNDDDDPLVWLGWHPAAFGEYTPPFWELIPQPAQRFLRTVHAGFAAADCASHGLAPLADMKTFADWAGFDEVQIADWDRYQSISCTRLMVLTKDDGQLTYCLSPDIPRGKIVLLYEGDIDPREDVATALDELMARRFEEG